MSDEPTTAAAAVAAHRAELSALIAQHPGAGALVAVGDPAGDWTTTAVTTRTTAAATARKVLATTAPDPVRVWLVDTGELTASATGPRAEVARIAAGWGVPAWQAPLIAAYWRIYAAAVSR